MTINTPPLEDFWLILYTESLFSLEIGTETMFQTDLYQSSLSVYKVNNVQRPMGSFKLYKESIIVLAFFINFRIPPNLDQ